MTALNDRAVMSFITNELSGSRYADVSLRGCDH